MGQDACHNLTEHIKRGRAYPADRRVMDRTVVGAMHEHCPNPNRAACMEVAKMIISKYTLTFTDTIEGGQLGISYFSLVNQLKTKTEHVNRNNTCDRIWKPRTTEGGNAGSATKTVSEMQNRQPVLVALTDTQNRSQREKQWGLWKRKEQI